MATPSSPSHFLSEALDSPDVVERLCNEAWPLLRETASRLREPPRYVVINARGSSGNAGLFAKYLIESECNVFVGHCAQSSVTAYGARIPMRGVLFLSISQSGQSADLVQSAIAARRDGALTVAIVNDARSPLAGASEIVLPMMAGTEASTAASKSFVASLAIILGLVAAWRGEPDHEETFRRLPAMLFEASTQAVRDFESALAAVPHRFVIGRGFGYALAEEAALKFKEVCGLNAEGFSAAEVRHGPIALANRSLGVLAFDQRDATSPSIREALAVATANGASPILIEPPPARGPESARPFDAAARAIALTLSFYRHVESLARRIGRDPDRPDLITKITTTT
jgi:glutamine---fructose-6-phosphate transaminase (isomerizing)